MPVLVVKRPIDNAECKYRLALEALYVPNGTTLGWVPLVVDDGAGGRVLEYAAITGTGDADTLDGFDSTDFILQIEKAVANGVATLDSGGKLPTGQLPSLAITDVFTGVTSDAAMIALAAQQGDIAIRTDLNATYILAGSNPAILANWVQLATTASGGLRETTTLTSAVLAADGQETGSFTLAKAAVLIRAKALFPRKCRIRIYGTSAARDADLSRPPETSAVSGSGTTGTGIATDLVLSEDESYDLFCDPKPVLANHADPSTTTLYYTLDNLTTGSVAVAVELYHVPIEA